jgi:hypothetical protein
MSVVNCNLYGHFFFLLRRCVDTANLTYFSYYMSRVIVFFLLLFSFRSCHCFLTPSEMFFILHERCVNCRAVNGLLLLFCLCYALSFYSDCTSFQLQLTTVLPVTSFGFNFFPVVIFLTPSPLFSYICVSISFM